MSFLQQEPTTFIGMKLTKYGRRMASLGKLTFDKAIFLDREIDYGFARQIDYNHGCNSVIAPKDDVQIINPLNFDGSPAFSLEGKILSQRQIATAITEDIGFFFPAITGDTPTANQYRVRQELTIGSGRTDFVYVNGTNTLSLDLSVSYTGTNFQFGSLAVMDFKPSGVVGFTGYLVARPWLWYRFTGTQLSNIVLDRKLPNYSGSPGGIDLTTTFYPWSGITRLYDQGKSQVTPVWNLSIVRTVSEIGANDQDSEFFSYGAIEFNGFVKYLGLEKDHRVIGILHYTNSGTGNTFAEQLAPNSTDVIIPTLMWHRYDVPPGAGQFMGNRFTDRNSDVYYDSIAKTNFTLLMDGVDDGAIAVGRVYFKLKIIVITDPELLTVMSYKSNRNWTLPPLKLDYSQYSLSGFTGASGVCETGKTYYVTYKTSSSLPFGQGISYGYQPSMHCGYIQKIKGLNDINGNPMFMTASFPKRAFPYLANPYSMAMSGLGWSCNSVQLMMCEVDDSENVSIHDLPHKTWKLIPNLSGCGIYSSTTMVSATGLTNFNFIVSRQDFNSGQTYYLNQHYPEFYNKTNHNVSGLTYGDESFFFGNVSTTILATSYKTTITLPLANDMLNSSLNTSFDGALDKSTFITEICILNNENKVVGLAKPTFPIEKNDARYLTFELEIDF